MRVFYIVFSFAMALFLGFGGYACDPTPLSEKRFLDAGNKERRKPNESLFPLPDGTSGDTKKKPQGCPSSWSVTMSSVQANTRVYAVFCPPPTISGCHSLHKDKMCVATSSPLILFIHDIALKSYSVEHSGAIEDNSHGKLQAAPDATQPDRLTNLPNKTKITALFSGVSISFQFDGDKVTVFSPK